MNLELNVIMNIKELPWEVKIRSASQFSYHVTVRDRKLTLLVKDNHKLQASEVTLGEIN